PIARAIEECHHQAVADTLQFLEEQVAFARMGARGVAQVDTTGLIAAAFDHRDSRAGDPNLHTHLVISNKVQAIGADGIPRWLALDGTPLHHATVAASELYNTRLEAHAIAKLGVGFAET
ncbi:MobF family relaxase, partial [Mycobacterium avium]